jgi:2-phosphosulfolactate phosphatase
MIHWHCHDVFQRMPPRATAGGVAVVIDVLRASTTIATALAHGAVRVVPVRGLDDARACAAALGPGTLLGGERGGVRIAGFDFGNSPLEYSRERVDGRSLVITTTNGTAALDVCRVAREVVVGAIVNRTAVAAAVRRLAASQGITDVHLVCAGTDGEVTAEDLLAAGAILDAAARAGAADDLDPPARAALERFRSTLRQVDVSPAAALAAAFATSPGGSNLIALGMVADLPACAAIDSLGTVPRLDPATGSLI